MDAAKPHNTCHTKRRGVTPFLSNSVSLIGWHDRGGSSPYVSGDNNYLNSVDPRGNRTLSCRELYTRIEKKLEYDDKVMAAGWAIEFGGSQWASLISGKSWEAIGMETAAVYHDLGMWGAAAFSWNFDFMSSMFIGAAVPPWDSMVEEIAIETGLSLLFGAYIADFFASWPPTGDTECEKKTRELGHIHRIAVMAANVADWWSRWQETAKEYEKKCSCVPEYLSKMDTRKARWVSHGATMRAAVTAAKEAAETACGLDFDAPSSPGDGLPDLMPDTFMSVPPTCGSDPEASCNFCREVD